MSKALRRFMTILGIGGLLGGAYACVDEVVPTSPGSSANEAAIVGSPSDDAANAAAVQRVATAKARSERSGRIHHAAMQDLLGNLPAAGPKAGRLARRCEAAARLTLKFMPEIEQSYGVSWTPAERRQLVSEAFRSIGPCSAYSDMSLFGAEIIPTTTTMLATSMDDPPGTEAVVAPINALVAAIKASNGTVAAVSAITEASLEDNSQLGSVDLEILASVAALANSSAVEWNTYSAQGGFGTETWEGEWDWNANGGTGGPAGCPGEEECEEPQSIFRGFWRKAAFVVGSDVIGCGTAALATWWSGAAGAGSSCAIWGLGTSATSLLGVLLLE